MTACGGFLCAAGACPDCALDTAVVASYSDPAGSLKAPSSEGAGEGPARPHADRSETVTRRLEGGESGSIPDGWPSGVLGGSESRAREVLGARGHSGTVLAERAQRFEPAALPQHSNPNPQADHTADAALGGWDAFDVDLGDEERPREVIPDAATELEELTAEQQAELKTQLDALAMEEDLYLFLRGAWPEVEPGTEFEDGQHIRAVCLHIQIQLEERAIALGLMPKPAGWSGMRAQRLLIRIPPRCLKTIITSVCASAWAWIRWPTLRILSLSNNPRVTSEASDKVRSLIRSEWYQKTFRPTWTLRDDSSSLSVFKNSAGGWRAARGMMSRITGEGADWLMIDDPHDGDEVWSKPKRDGVNDKWRRSTSTRVNDPRFSIFTCIMQALHFDDFGQHRIAEGWGVLLIRMQLEERDIGRRSPYGWTDWRTVEGESVLPGRFSLEWCEQTKSEKGALIWHAQFQQDPAPIDGGIIKESDLRYYDPDSLPALESMLITVDAAFKKTTKGSRVSVLVIGRKGPDRFVIANDTRPMHMGDTKAAIRKMMEQYPRARHTILIEDKANGSEIIRELQLELPGVIAVNPGSNSKEGRLMACQSMFLSHNVYFPRLAPWLDDMRYELCTFPNAPKDDQVDALVQGLLHMRSSTAAARSRAGCQA